MALPPSNPWLLLQLHVRSSQSSNSRQWYEPGLCNSKYQHQESGVITLNMQLLVSFEYGIGNRGGTKQVFETRISQIQDSTSFLVSPCGRKGFCTVFRQKCWKFVDPPKVLFTQYPLSPPYKLKKIIFFFLVQTVAYYTFSESPQWVECRKIFLFEFG